MPGRLSAQNVFPFLAKLRSSQMTCLLRAYMDHPDTTSYKVWKLFDQVFVVVLHVKKGFSLTFLTVLQAA